LGSVTQGWLTVILVGGLSVAIKASGPVLLGGRNLPAKFGPVSRLLAPALFAALVVTQVFVHGKAFAADARAAGLAVAFIGAYRRAPPLVVLAAAVAVTAIIRHFS
jgi:branched-subunit amino acid transport protein